MDELRRKRLIALGVLSKDEEEQKENNIDKDTTNTTTTKFTAVASAADTAEARQSRKGTACEQKNETLDKEKGKNHAAASREEEVFDLCSSSEDDDTENVNVTRNQKRIKDDDDEDDAELESKRRAKRGKNSHEESGKKSDATVKKVNTDPNNTKTEAIASSSSFSSSLLTFQVVTWNVWFGPPNDANPHVVPRMNELIRSAVHGKRPQYQKQASNNQSTYTPPWFIGLQEVTRESAPILKAALGRAGYSTTVLQDEAEQGVPYFCMLAVRHHQVVVARGPSSSSLLPTMLEAGSVGYENTCMARGFCYARVRLPGTTGNTTKNSTNTAAATTTGLPQLLVATTHLESFAGKDYSGAVQRQQQLLEFEENLKDEFCTHSELKWAILMGDLNWDDERKKGAPDAKMDTFLTLPFQDVWLNSGGDDETTRYTYDGKLNPMLGNSMRRRFDRCLLFARNQECLKQFTSPVGGLQLLGQEALPGLRFTKTNPWNHSKKEYPVAPSDHFGLVSRLQVKLLS